MAPDTVKGIQHIEVNKDDLIKELEKNRAQHEADFKEAFEGYRAALGEDLKKKLSLWESKQDVPHFIQLDVPEDHTKDYDRVIGMLKMSIDKTVIITTQEYSQYVMDDWGWKERFTNTSQAYAVAKGKR